MASRSGDGDPGDYLCGAGDDEDNWAHGLEPHLFWQHREELVEMADTDPNQLPGFINQIALKDQQTINSPLPTSIHHTILHIGSISLHQSVKILELLDSFDAIIICCDEPKILSQQGQLEDAGIAQKMLQLHCRRGKLGSRALRKKLVDVVSFVSGTTKPDPKILVACPSGKDLAVGVALAINCIFYDDHRKLCWIMLDVCPLIRP